MTSSKKGPIRKLNMKFPFSFLQKDGPRSFSLDFFRYYRNPKGNQNTEVIILNLSIGFLKRPTVATKTPASDQIT